MSCKSLKSKGKYLIPPLPSGVTTKRIKERELAREMMVDTKKKKDVKGIFSVPPLRSFKPRRHAVSRKGEVMGDTKRSSDFSQHMRNKHDDVPIVTDEFEEKSKEICYCKPILKMKKPGFPEYQPSRKKYNDLLSRSVGFIVNESLKMKTSGFSKYQPYRKKSFPRALLSKNNGLLSLGPDAWESSPINRDKSGNRSSYDSKDQKDKDFMEKIEKESQIECNSINSRHNKKIETSNTGEGQNRESSVVHQTLPVETNLTDKLSQTLPPEKYALISKSNIDFLPLVSEDNILRVNDKSYAKLGFIGKVSLYLVRD